MWDLIEKDPNIMPDLAAKKVVDLLCSRDPTV
jgi:hypothetical protein